MRRSSSLQRSPARSWVSNWGWPSPPNGEPCGYSLPYMVDAAQRHGYFDGKTMDQLTTRAGLQWLRQAIELPTGVASTADVPPAQDLSTARSRPVPQWSQNFAHGIRPTHFLTQHPRQPTSKERYAKPPMFAARRLQLGRAIPPA